MDGRIEMTDGTDDGCHALA